MCILISILFIGGYNSLNIFLLQDIISMDIISNYIDIIYKNTLIEGISYGLFLGLKSSIMIFVFIWVRASFPRIRFDQLMQFCWTALLPILFALIILIPCLLYIFNIIIINSYII